MFSALHDITLINVVLTLNNVVFTLMTTRSYIEQCSVYIDDNTIIH